MSAKLSRPTSLPATETETETATATATATAATAGADATKVLANSFLFRPLRVGHSACWPTKSARR